MKPILYIVIPCFNEQEVLPKTAPLFLEQLKKLERRGKISYKSRILFVDDGSRDNTWDIISKLSSEQDEFKGIALSRNRGHQNALLAGLMEAKGNCDITISIDCDGQDDISVMEKMVDEYLGGAEIVYGVRNNRSKDGFFKRHSAQGFYRFMQRMGAEVVYNHADYRLISSRALEELAKFGEVNIFLRGMVPLVGFKSTCVYYERNERIAGKGHYPLKKMISLALNGITSLSIKPIRIITILGFIVAIISGAGVLWSVITALLGKTVAGWASTVSIVCFLGGIQLLSLGVIGEYIGKVYLEVKNRPKYIIAERTETEKSED
jgi:glycosyltransferase involved in cell wall biosynthesis